MTQRPTSSNHLHIRLLGSAPMAALSLFLLLGLASVASAQASSMSCGLVENLDLYGDYGTARLANTMLTTKIEAIVDTARVDTSRPDIYEAARKLMRAAFLPTRRLAYSTPNYWEARLAQMRIDSQEPAYALRQLCNVSVVIEPKKQTAAAATQGSPVTRNVSKAEADQQLRGVLQRTGTAKCEQKQVGSGWIAICD